MANRIPTGNPENLKLFIWDEITNETEEVHPHDLFMACAEGGWLTVGWSEDLKVECRATDRHQAMETWAKDKEEAVARFMEFPIYKEANTFSEE